MTLGAGIAIASVWTATTICCWLFWQQHTGLAPLAFFIIALLATGAIAR